MSHLDLAGGGGPVVIINIIITPQVGQSFSALIPGQHGQFVENGSMSAFKEINWQVYLQSEFYM